MWHFIHPCCPVNVAMLPRQYLLTHYLYIFVVFIKNGHSDGQPKSGPAIFNDVTCKCAYMYISHID